MNEPRVRPDPVDWRAAVAALTEMMPGWEVRPGQERMMGAVAGALAAGNDLLIEAGTGTGKTLAYLLPVLASGKRTIIATATRQLQSQLLEHDLPLACDAAGLNPDIAVLKGRRNYLCHLRIEHRTSRDLAEGRQLEPALAAVARALRGAREGDIAEVLGVSENDPVWPEVTSTTDNCLGGDCAFHDQCFVLRARRKAMQADVVVVNHHLLLADHAVRERWQGAMLLPGASAIVIDEAHALEDVAASLFGASLSRQRIGALLHELAVVRDEAGDRGTMVEPVAAGLSRAATQLFDELAATPPQTPLDAARCRDLAPAADDLLQALNATMVVLSGSVSHVVAGANQLRESLRVLRTDLLTMLDPSTADGSDGFVRQVEQRRMGASVVARPVAVGPIMQRTLLAEPAVRIFTSATLAMGDDFSLIRSRLGLAPEVPALRVPGAFDYANQALLYLPRALPEPFKPGREEAVADEIERLASAAGGSTFALFTSRRGMRAAHRRLDGRLPMRCLLQGQESREAILNRFVQEQPAVLFATMGFWQGVDLPGDVLRMVVIDKIPFPPPDDPLFAARARLIEAEGGSSFRALSLPAAATSLRQGFGRLIRTRRDHGVVAILDPRLSRRPYGRRLLAALPPARRTAVFPAVGSFLYAAGQAAGDEGGGNDW